MLRIVVKSTQVEVKKGTGRNGRPYEIREQNAFLVSGDEVRKLNINLGRDQSAYAVGDYDVHSDSFEVDRFNNLQIGRLQLTPAAPRAGMAKAG